MIDHDRKLIYVDYSTLATFQSCKEKARLAHWRAATPDKSLAFGHAFHAAIAAYDDACAGGRRAPNGAWIAEPPTKPPLLTAKAAFLHDLAIEGADLPIDLEVEERRSLARGLALVEAYITRWANEPYETMLDEHGAPLVEVGFHYPLCEFQGWTVIYVGYIDKIMRHKMTKRVVMRETKTTTEALSQFIKQCKPNHQVTGYFVFARRMFPDIIECIWDCVFVSDRAADMRRAEKEHFMMWGVDIDKDFKRQPTTRHMSDITEFLWDAHEHAYEYAKWLLSGAIRWPRSAPGACHMFGGCRYRDVCVLNDAAQRDAFLQTRFVEKPWQPWKGIIGA